MEKLKKILKNRLFLTLFISVQVLIIFFVYGSFGAPIEENDVRVKPNSDLTYYLDVIYDGKDSELITSSDTATCEVRSDYIYVEDKLPEGLTFKKFLAAEDGTIGAVKRSDGTGCPGYVVDDFAGLHYDEETRMVSFKVKNLKAGCKLTVGIVTTTPSLGDKNRIDFYNTAFARENDFTTKSNTVHAFIGKEEATLYTVNYVYNGDVPENAPAAPVETSYAYQTVVGVEQDPVVSGYNFSGWTTEDVTVTDNSFEMPQQNVTFVGTFEKKPTYKVSYKVTGDKPSGYIAPTEKSYGAKDDVILDTLSEGDIVNGYKFLGWTTTSAVDLTDGIFQMPEENVELVGTFERISYKVTYEFQGTIIPENATSLLPEEKSYYPGDTVTVADALANTRCTVGDNPTLRNCEFLDWYKNKTFEMPEEDVVIYGEWQIKNGYFTPTITKEIPNKKNYYHDKEEVPFKITVTNTASYEIKDVILEEKLEKASFQEGEGYTIRNEKFVNIATIPAGGSIEINAKYIAGNDVLKTYKNEVEIIGALADDDNYLDTTKKYIAEDSFTVANISLVINKINKENEPLTGAEFTLYSDRNLTTKVQTGLTFKNLSPSTIYYLKETKAPSGYVLEPRTMEVIIDSNGSININEYEVSNVDGVGTVNIVNDEINILPNTGGPGNIWYIIIGILVVAVSAVVYIIHLKKKEGDGK